MNDPLLQLLDGLPSARLDPSRADRIRVRCHAALAHQRRRASHPDRTIRHWPPIAVALGGLYLTEVLHQVLALYGIV
jgi:hypothetical protein